jgi:hypothetical protein
VLFWSLHTFSCAGSASFGTILGVQSPQIYPQSLSAPTAAFLPNGNLAEVSNTPSGYLGVFSYNLSSGWWTYHGGYQGSGFGTWAIGVWSATAIPGSRRCNAIFDPLNW